MKVVKTEYKFPYTPYKSENYSLKELIESRKKIDEPIGSILQMIYNYIQNPVNDKDVVYLLGKFKHDEGDKDGYYKHTAYQVKFDGKSYGVKMGIDDKDAWLIKVVITTIEMKPASN